jgi:hypothetical protein
MSTDATPWLHLQPSAVECPPWCDRDPGHGYRVDLDGPGHYRAHTRHHQAAGFTAEIWQDERAAGPAGPILRSQPRAHLDADIPGMAPDEMTSTQLRALAAALTACADDLDALHATPDHHQH